jgi:ATP-binding cassette, subfamily B (MDR/TAP), member 1
VNANYSV